MKPKYEVQVKIKKSQEPNCGDVWVFYSQKMTKQQARESEAYALAIGFRKTRLVKWTPQIVAEMK